MADAVYRQWLLLQMIPRAPAKADAASLAARLRERGVAIHHRSVQRDLHALAALFPLVHDDAHKPYGWSWRRDARAADIPGLDVQTAVAFRLVADVIAPLLPRAVLRALEPHFRAASGLLARLPGAPLAAWPDLVRVLPRGQALLPPRVEPAVAQEVNRALLERRRLRIAYRSRGADEPRDHEVHPLALVFRSPVAYLVCTFWDFGEVTFIPLHRMARARMLEAPRSVPDGYDLDAFIARGGLGFPLGAGTRRLKARFDRRAAVTLRETPLSADQALTALDADHVLVEATVADTVDLRTWLLGFGEMAEVLEPESLREELRDTALAMARLYGAGGSGGS